MNPLVNQMRLQHTTQLFCIYDMGDNGAMFHDIAKSYQLTYLDVCWISLHAAVVRLTGGGQDQIEQDIRRWLEIQDYQHLTPDPTNGDAYSSFVMNIDFTASILLGVLSRMLNLSRYEWIVADRVEVIAGTLYLGLAVIEGV